MYGYGSEQYTLSDSYNKRRPKIPLWLIITVISVAVAAAVTITVVHIIKTKKTAEALESAIDEAASENRAAIVPVMVPVDTPVWTGEEEEEPEPPLNVEPDDRTVGVSDEVVSEYAVLISLSENRVVAAKNCRQKMYPASMTKVLTVLVAAEHIEDMSQLDDLFEMTQAIEGFSYENGCSNVGFMPGEKIPVRDLFYGTILPSGADAAMGLAEYIAGSQEAFVDMMNEKVEELGLSETSHFMNCVGLYDDEHYTTAMDMAVIMDAAMKNDISREALTRHIYTTTATAEHPDGITVSNWFLRRIEDKQETGEILGAKTGFVNQSKNCAVSYGVSDEGKPFICVTGASSSSWRCIYDHVDIYTKLAFSE